MIRERKDVKVEFQFLGTSGGNHSPGVEEPLNYIITEGKVTLFYGLDTGWFLPQSYDIIKEFKCDLVIVEGTLGFASWKYHFGFKETREAHALFQKDRLLKEGAYFVATHFSPHGVPVYEEIASDFKKEDIIVAYDGMKLKI